MLSVKMFIMTSASADESSYAKNCVNEESFFVRNVFNIDRKNPVANDFMQRKLEGKTLFPKVVRFSVNG
jgi:hypothetical protein